MDSDIIYFYDKETEYVKKEHLCLNNFEPSPFIDENNEKWISVEHYYQAHKFDNFEDGSEFKTAFTEIQTAEDADKCKKASRKYTREILKDKWQENKWENLNYKDKIMQKALTFKFSQNIDMLKILLSTKGKTLIERSERDPYWGGFLPDSKNMLGKMLMEIRDNYLTSNTVFIDGSGLTPINVEMK